MVEISVLMGTYNEKKEYVIRAIESILKQTYAEFEFIICDDASEEEFFQWLKEYCKKDERIILLRNEKNIGLAPTLNRCLDCAKSQYVARMDADDVSRKTRFEKQKAFLDENTDYALVGSNVLLIDENASWGGRKLPANPEKNDFLFGSPFVHPAIMVRRSALVELSGYAEGKFACRTEDYELFMRLYAKGYKGHNLQESLFEYREERGSFQKRKYRYRINEARVRYRGFKSLDILQGHMLYVIKPLIVGLIPTGIMRRIREKKFGASI